MAVKVAEFPPSGREYPWELWADGDVWKLTHGEDFDTKPETFRTTVKKAAARLGRETRTSIRKDTDGTHLYVMFKPKKSGSSRRGS